MPRSDWPRIQEHRIVHVLHKRSLVQIQISVQCQLSPISRRVRRDESSSERQMEISEARFIFGNIIFDAVEKQETTTLLRREIMSKYLI